MWELAAQGHARTSVQSQTQMRKQDQGNHAERVRRSVLVAVGQNRESAVTAADGRTAGICLIDTRCSGLSW